MKTIPPPTTSQFLKKLLVVSFLLMLFSCFKDQELVADKPIVDFVDPSVVKTEEDKQNARAIIQITKALRKIYKDPKVVEEVNAAIATGYYADERVLLKDLLNPIESPVYKSEVFLKREEERGFKPGLFKEKLEKELGTVANSNFRTSDLYFEDNGLSIYFPYHEDTQYNSYPVTVAAATVEADQVWAYSPYAPEPGSVEPETLDNYAVLVDDNYASVLPVHVVGMGAEMNSHTADHNCSNVKVSIGYVKVLYSHNYDVFISFSFNGGGPELVFIGAKAVRHSTELATITTYNRIAKESLSRKEARNGTWVAVWGTLDEYWSPSSVNQLFGIYEEDYTHEKKYFTGTFEYNNQGWTSYPNCYIEVSSKNDIVSDYFPERSYFVYLANTYGGSSEYLTGYGPQFTSTDGFVRYSLPITCY
jgi:hypothetical protein